MRVADIMHSPVETVDAYQSADEAWRLALREGAHHLVAVRSGEVLGALSDDDLRHVVSEQSRSVRLVSDCLHPTFTSVTPDMTVADAAGLMRICSLDWLPVFVDGAVTGFVTRDELLPQGQP